MSSFTPEDVPVSQEGKDGGFEEIASNVNEKTGLATTSKDIKVSQSEGLLVMDTWASQGPLTFKVLGTFGGFCMACSGTFGLFGEFTPLHATIESYMLIFGIMIVMLESSQFLCPANLKETVLREAKFLQLLSGRGAFYVFLGSLLLTQWPNFFDALLGIYMMSIGIVMILIGGHAAAKLTAMSGHMTDEATVHAEFNKVDADGNGYLNYQELADLCQNLGSKLSREELIACMSELDSNGNNVVEYYEFLDWWEKTSVKSVVHSPITEHAEDYA